MGNTSSFNTCSRCGAANTLSAKYCYQCGSQLKAPEEPKACAKCGTINSGLSNYCRKCGATLTSNTLVKYCPQCRRQVPAVQSVCDCGYSFEEGSSLRKNRKVVVNRGGNGYAGAVASTNGMVGGRAMSGSQAKKSFGRLGALLSLLIILALAYMMFAPNNLRWSLLYDMLPLYVVNGAPTTDNWYNIVMVGYNAIVSKTFPTDVHTIVMLVMVIIVALCMVVHLLGSLVRIIAGRRRRPLRSNIFYLVMFLLTGIIAAILFLSTNDKLKFLKLFAPANGSVSYLVFAVPVYFLLFWLGSLFTKKDKERIKAKKDAKKAKKAAKKAAKVGQPQQVAA